MATHAGPYRRQLSVGEADGCVESPAGHLTVCPQEMVAVDPTIPLYISARAATYYRTRAVHCSSYTHARYLFSYLFFFYLSPLCQLK